MSLDFNDAGSQQDGEFSPIPEGAVAPVRLLLNGIKKSTTGATGLDIEYVVTAGPYAKRKVWAWTGVAGNGSDGHNKMVDISRAFIRAALESAYGVDPADASPEAKAARSISEYEDLDGLEFVARFKIEEGKDYTDQRTGEVKSGKAKNTLMAVTPDDPDYNGFKPAKRKAASAGNGMAKPPAGAASSAHVPNWART